MGYAGDMVTQVASFEGGFSRAYGASHVSLICSSERLYGAVLHSKFGYQ
jgi:hypothetical protein